jgi:hypothetical protein
MHGKTSCVGCVVSWTFERISKTYLVIVIFEVLQRDSEQAILSISVQHLHYVVFSSGKRQEQ